MSTKQISRYSIPHFDDLPEDIQAIQTGAKEGMGFIPNVFKALAHRPAEFRAFMAYYEATMKKESGLSDAEKEMLIVAHSNHNGCTYCVMSHGATLRMVQDNKNLAEQVAINYHEADITPREKAIIGFAMKVTTDSQSIHETDFDTLKSHGLSQEDIWDIAAITAFFNLSNRMMNFAAIRADNEFYTMGR